MEFKKIFEMQKMLDKAYSNAGHLKTENINEKRLVAILVEMGEFANEYAPFKYWKINKSNNRLKIIEEFVDGIHFFSTLMNDLGVKETIIKSKIISQDKTIQLLETFEVVALLRKDFNEKSIKNAFGIYLGNARLLGISNEEIETSYIKKNKINFQRIKEGY